MHALTAVLKQSFDPPYLVALGLVWLAAWIVDAFVFSFLFGLLELEPPLWPVASLHARRAWESVGFVVAVALVSLALTSIRRAPSFGAVFFAGFIGRYWVRRMIEPARLSSSTPDAGSPRDSGT